MRTEILVQLRQLICNEFQYSINEEIGDLKNRVLTVFCLASVIASAVVIFSFWYYSKCFLSKT